MKRIEGYIRWLNKLREGRRKTIASVLVMSLIVSGNVFWFLRGVGTALTDEPSCGLTEHSHTDECYERRLICGYGADVDPDIHVHTDGCYETVLTCEKEEHTHTDKCYISSNLHETPSVWEATIPELTGDACKDLVNVAMSQTGYSEGENGYSRYGDWYGNPNGDWNVMFVSFCLNYAGISSEKIPYGSGCWSWQVKLSESDLLNTESLENILEGDIILIDEDGDGKCDLAGITCDVTDGLVSIIAGDINGKTDIVTYDINDKKIYGYVSVNDLCASDEETQAAEENEAVLEFDDVTASGINVHVTAPQEAFPEGVTMSATDVNDEEVIAQAEEEAGKLIGEDDEVKGTLAVDISFTDRDGNEVEPYEGKMIDVSITIPTALQLDGDEYQLFHVNDDGIASVDDAAVSAKEASFTTDGFSIYVVTATGERDKDELHAYIHTRYITVPDGVPTGALNGDNIKNSREYPYMMRVGDEITLIARVNDGSTPDLDYYDNYGTLIGVGVVTIENETPTVGEVRATIRAVAPGDAALRIVGSNPEETFSIHVISQVNYAQTIDFDNIMMPGDGSIPEIHIKYHDSVKLIGTPNGSNNYPFISSSDSWIFDNMVWMSEGGKNGITFTADHYNINNRTQTISMETGGTFKTVRIVIDPDMTDVLDHADIEIADGGKYTSVVIEGGGASGMYKTVTEYQSHVNYVNSCNLYKADGSPVFVFHREENSATWETTECTPIGQPHFSSKDNDYWHDENFNPGDSQYELTSKYHRIDIDEDNYYFIYSKKRFYYQEVDKAVFDVKMDIVPSTVKKYIWNGTAWEHLPDEDITYNIDFDHDVYTKTQAGVTETVLLSNILTVDESEIFELDRTAVIDAYNKCPNHSGLDFTVHTNNAMLRFEAGKQLIGRALNDGEFEFGIYDNEACTGTPVIETAVNNTAGEIVFKEMSFDHDGEFTYYMKELPGSLPDIKYDETVYRVEIKVENMIADIKTFKYKDDSDNWVDATRFHFTNYYKFTLPDTGGTGLAPYLISGVAIIATSITLLILRRRKEVDI